MQVICVHLSDSADADDSIAMPGHQGAAQRLMKKVVQGGELSKVSKAITQSHRLSASNADHVPGNEVG